MIRSLSVLISLTLFFLTACGGADGEGRRLSVDAPPNPGGVDRVTALGRIEPDELVRLAGPARPSVVVAELLVDEGDEVEAGQVVAVLDTVPVEEAEIEERRVELANAELELSRMRDLRQRSVKPQSELDRARQERDSAAARLRRATAELARSKVMSPVAGRVVAVHVRAGERVGSDGIVEIADVDPMYVIAEVYETDIGKVRVGQKATVWARALPGGKIEGRVTRIGTKVGRKDVLDTDPVADADARVIEVEIELDDESASRLIHLRVEVAIHLEDG